MFTLFIAFLTVEMTALNMFCRDKKPLLKQLKKPNIYLTFTGIHLIMCMLGYGLGVLAKIFAPIGSLEVILSSLIYVAVAIAYLVRAVKAHQLPVPKNVNLTILALQAILSGMYLLPIGVSASLAGVSPIPTLVLSAVLPAVIVFFGLSKYETKTKLNTIIFAVITALSAVLDWVLSIIS